MPGMMEISQFADTLGRKNIAAAVAVSPTAVSNAVARRKKFPPSWYDPLERLAKEAGISCPRDMFAWRASAGRDPADRAAS